MPAEAGVLSSQTGLQQATDATPRVEHTNSAIPNRMNINDINPNDDRKAALSKLLAEPDFRYPATVAANADSIYAAAITSGKPVSALRAAMQWNVATAIITPDSLPDILGRYRFLEQKLPQPYSAFASLLEARLLKDVYNESRYIYDSRTLAEDSADPRLWSAAMFRDRILNLCASVMSQREALASMPVGVIAPLIENAAEAEAARLSSFDFACYRMIDILSSFTSSEPSHGNEGIPFTNLSDAANPDSKKIPAEGTDRLTPLGVADILVATDSIGARKDSRALLQARIRRLGLLSGKAQKDYLTQLLSLYPQDAEARPELVAYADRAGLLRASGPDEVQKVYNLLNATIEKHPKSQFTPLLKRSLKELSRPYIRIEAPDRILPRSSGKANYSLNNLSDCYLLLVPLPKPTSYDYPLLQHEVLSRKGASVLKHISPEANIPFSLSDSIDIPPLAPGYYTIIPSSSKTLSGHFRTLDDNPVPIINVTGISLFTSRDTDSRPQSANHQNPGWLYVTDASTGAPVNGAQVRMREIIRNYPRSYGKEITISTDAEGKVKIPFDRAQAEVTHAGSSMMSLVGIYGSYEYNPALYTADILTDLSLYHPGDSVQWVGIVSRRDGNLLSPAANVPLKATFFDANGEEIGSSDASSDSSGRAIGSFLIPTSGLTGSFRISLSLAPEAAARTSSGQSHNNMLVSSWIEVAEYKAPTFRVTVDKTEMKADTAVVSGSVTTYSGMPLPATKVDISIQFHRRWWWRHIPDYSNLPSSFGATVTTDENGRFTLPLGLDHILGTPYEAGFFTLEARATSPAGETQNGSGAPFAVAPGFSISMDNATVEVTSDSISIPVRVMDAVGQPARKTVAYTVANSDGEVICKGDACSPELSLQSDLLPSGRYTVSAILPDAAKAYEGEMRGRMVADTARAHITVWRAADRRPPYPTQLWIPRNIIYAADDAASSVEVVAGSGFADSWLFYQIASCDSVIRRGWVKASDANVVIDTPVPALGNEVRVTFRSEHNLESSLGSVTVRPAESRKRLAFRTETFRDRINPMAREQWRFRLMCDSLPSAHSAVMAVLSDAALNAIHPFEWSMDPYRIISRRIQGEIENFYSRYNPVLHGYLTVISGGSSTPRFFPDFNWNLWGHSLFSRFGGREMFYACAESTSVSNQALSKSVAIRGSVPNAAPAAGMVEEDFAMDEMAVEKELADSGSDSSQAESAMPDIPLRDTSCPLAFFRPLLSTDADGMVTIDFDVPNFNTTWALQLIGYDDLMRTARLELQTVASKPVMISTNMPRFLLTGDKATVEVTMFNNSDSELPLTGIIEIFDPATGKVIASHKEKNVTVLPSGNASVSVRFNTPTDISALGVRASVECPAGSDGEQQLIQVLPASQPVMDATTFYLTPSDSDLTVKLPHMSGNDKVTLNYCANPAWYVLTSLSGLIESDSESTLANLNSLYANSVAAGLLGRYPSLANGLRKIFDSDRGESLITSPLEKNENLKISSLGETPWVNNAASETARMHSLNTLTDAAAAGKSISAIIDILLKNQKSDGSFSWMPQMDGSEWISLNVIDCAARIAESGYTPADSRWTDMVGRTLKRTDEYEAKEYRKAVKEGYTYPLSSEISYLLNRSLLTDRKTSGGLAEMERDMMRRLPAEWGTLSISEKAQAARILHRHGKDQLARDIMRSVLEFASYKPDKGMWFDNLGNTWFGLPAKLITADCIMALNEIMPGDEAIMKMCQYLVLSRQGEDWNVDMSPGAVTATVNAVMGSDLGWTALADAPAPEITLDGKPIPLPSDAEMLTGNIYVNLDPSQVSGGELKISRHPGLPAWGGVLRQYLMPAADVKAADVPQLSVTKQLLPITLTASGEEAGKNSGKFRKGDLIRVTLTLQSDRDLDYILIRDCRGAFMQPKEQLTQYEVNDGVWVLRETRRSATNFYLTRLPKGSYILTYDVYADRDGEYSTGIATAQSQYYPMITAHSAGALITVK